MNRQEIEAVFWEQKGIENPEMISHKERIAFIVELKSFIEGYIFGAETILRKWSDSRES